MPYKDYNQNELMLLPTSLLDLIAEKDLVKVINSFVDELPKAVVEDEYNRKTGCPLFHPRMMLKVIIPFPHQTLNKAHWNPTKDWIIPFLFEISLNVSNNLSSILSMVLKYRLPK